MMNLSAIILSLLLLGGVKGTSSSGSSSSVFTHRVLRHDDSGRPRFIQGDLGTLQVRRELGILDIFDPDNVVELLEAATDAIRTILKKLFNATGKEKLIPSVSKFFRDKSKNFHIHFTEIIDGLGVDGAALVLHVGKNLNVYAINGEFVSSTDLLLQDTKVDCEEAFQNLPSYINDASEVTWLTECSEAVVVGFDGTGHRAWKRLIGYKPKNQPYQKDLLYSSVVNGEIVAVFPQVLGLSLETRDCQQTTNDCIVVSTSSNPISTGDEAVDNAHNFAILVHEFFAEYFERNSIDDNDLPLISYVHYGVDMNNAGWDEWNLEMVYGDGDGVDFSPLSNALDIVAHEFTHGITQHSSGLIYRDEPGAINEAMSDIMAAAIERLRQGVDVSDTWKIGEDVWTPGMLGDALRYMNDPTLDGFSRDYYPDRYIGESDNGGVHINSGIANLAFVLMTDGGTHPQGKTSIEVPAIDADFDTSLLAATSIFYYANIGCLAPYSNFEDTRYCTSLFAAQYGENVELAWNAVGVGGGEGATLPPGTEYVDLESGVPLTGQSGATDSVTHYRVEGVDSFESVTCALSGDNGDADLYMRLGEQADPDSHSNDCMSTSFDSNEACYAESYSPTTLFAAVKAFTEYEELTITCIHVESTEGVAAQGAGETSQAFTLDKSTAILGAAIVIAMLEMMV